MMCHSIAQVKSTMGQGDFYLEYPKLHELAASKEREANPLGSATLAGSPPSSPGADDLTALDALFTAAP